ncbi:MAG: hypothetical protein KF716_13715 [Anaerolineae bacterium]|nr:hypothetical protein [Anaerolineae bacterium]
MPFEQTIANIVIVIILLGGPIFPLLLLAVEVGHWHEENEDPPNVGELETHS